MKSTFTEVAGLNKALRSIPKEANKELRKASKDIAAEIATDAQSAARAQGGTLALVASSIKAGSDRVPVIRAGASKKLPPHSDGRIRKGDHQTMGDLWFASEFGSKRYKQFKPWRGNGKDAGYALFPTIRHDHDKIAERYSKALHEALQKI